MQLEAWFTKIFGGASEIQFAWQVIESWLWPHSEILAILPAPLSFLYQTYETPNLNTHSPPPPFHYSIYDTHITALLNFNADSNSLISSLILNPPSFLLTPPHFHVSDIDMIPRPAVEYTSLRDIISEHPKPPPIVPPPNNSSWNEIPIKNPLVKQAALAYLQATPTPPDVARKGLFRTLKDRCFCRNRGDSGCFDCLNGVVFRAIAEFFVRFCEIRGMDDSEDEEEVEEGEIVD